MSELSVAALLAISEWIDDANRLRYESMTKADLVNEAMTLGRIIKVTEERGEAAEALIGAVGQNPRKGVTHTVDDVRKELLDVALTALAALVHLNGNEGDAVAALEAHILWIAERAGVLTKSAASPVDASLPLGVQPW